MISPLFNDADYQGMRAMLEVSQARHNALAGNVANVNTPGYQRRDVSGAFQDELQRALQSANPQELNQLKPKTELDTSTPSFRLDGNNVNLEREMVEIAKNGAQHEVSAAMIAKRYSMLRLAITGRA